MRLRLLPRTPGGVMPERTSCTKVFLGDTAPMLRVLGRWAPEPGAVLGVLALRLLAERVLLAASVRVAHGPRQPVSVVHAHVCVAAQGRMWAVHSVWVRTRRGQLLDRCHCERRAEERSDFFLGAGRGAMGRGGRERYF